MRLWSIHPRYLDAKGLVALWREALLARKVLAGKTRGYRYHPQLERFRDTPDPVAAIGAYLTEVFREAECRGYQFDKRKIRSSRAPSHRLLVTTSQLNYERRHLLNKLRVRDPASLARIPATGAVLPHPLFKKHPGKVETWEKQSGLN